MEWLTRRGCPASQQSSPCGSGPGSRVRFSTLNQDRSTKAAIYAEAGVPEYWIADVNGRTFTQLWSPSGAEYGERAEHPFGATLRATTIDGLEIDTTRL